MQGLKKYLKFLFLRMNLLNFKYLVYRVTCEVW